MAESIQVKQIGWWHERLADWMLANPHLSMGDAAKHFDVTRTWLSIVKNSDCFKIYWATRSGEFSNVLTEKVTDSIIDLRTKTAAVTELALDELSRRLDGAPEAIPMDTLLDVSQMGLKALGYGAKAASPSPTVNVNISTGLVSAEDLANARKRALEGYGISSEPAKLETKPTQNVIEGEVVEAPYARATAD